MAVVVDDLLLAYQEAPQLAPPHRVAYRVSLSPIILLQTTTERGGEGGEREREGEGRRERGGKRERGREGGREGEREGEREMHCQASSHKLLYRHSAATIHG